MSTTPSGQAAPSKFAELFALPNQDPYGGNYQALLLHFKPQSNEATAIKERLRAEAFMSERSPAYLICYTVVGEYYISAIHTPHSYYSLPGAALHQEDICFLGDVTGRISPQIVTFPAVSDFAPTSFEAWDDETFNALVDGSPDDPMVDFPAEGDGRTETRTFRNVQILPPRYVTTFLSKATYRPIEAYKLFRETVENEDSAALAAAEPLLHWLQAACYSSDGTDPVVMLAAGSLNRPLRVQEVEEQMDKKLRAALPSFGNTASATTVGADQGATVRAINSLTTTILDTETRRANREAAAKVKSIQDYYGDTGYQILQRVLRVTHERDFPDVFSTIANSKKKLERLALVDGLTLTADQLNLSQYVPVVTTELAKLITSCDFHHTDLEDFQSGVQPFQTTYRLPGERKQLQDLLHRWDELRESSSLQLSDMQFVDSAQKVGLPHSMDNCTWALKSFRVLLETILPAGHHMLTNYRVFLQSWDRNYQTLRENLEPVDYPYILRYVQLRVATWFKEQCLTPANLPAPELVPLVMSIQFGEQWKPRMPTKYTVNVPPSLTAMLGGQPIGTQPTTTTPASTTSSTANSPSAPARTRVPNLNYDERFTVFKESEARIRDIRNRLRTSGVEIPKNSQGVEHCLSYHILGFCWGNCTRTADHRPLSSAEATTLENWCTEHYN